MNHNVSQPSPANQAETGEVHYRDLVERGLAQAQQLGFDLHAALQADYGETGAGSPNNPNLVMDTAIELAETANLDAAYFDQPSKTILLFAAADSWAKTEQRTQSGAYDRTVTDEREMLADVVLITAGMQSGVVREISEQDPKLAEKYIHSEAGMTEDEKEAEKFLESLSDIELAEEVHSILAEDGEDSFLSEQRARFGLTAASERPFKVRVLKMAESKWDLTCSGFLPDVKYPDFSDDSEQAVKERSVAIAKAEELDKIAAPYINAHKEYEERFAGKLGSLAPAWINRDVDGNTVLTLTARHAYSLLNFSKDQSAVDPDNLWFIQGDLAIVKHEYGHTQRWMPLGPHAQLGLMLEERKAEWVSDDKQGYLDIKHMMRELGQATHINLVDQLEQAVGTEDPLSTFLAATAPTLGLRNVLLLLAAKPLPYEQFIEHSKQFADLRCIQTPGDASQLDAIIREAVERQGQETFARTIGEWVTRAAASGIAKESLEYFLSAAKRNGLTYSIPFYDQAIKNAYITPPDSLSKES